MDELQQRQRVVQWALAMIAGTPLAAGPYERHLLEGYVQGLLSIDEVLFLLDLQEAAPAAEINEKALPETDRAFCFSH